MSRHDEYAAAEIRRMQAYRDAFSGPAAQAWMAAMSPEERERAEAAGLLQPRLEGQQMGLSLEELTEKQMPTVEPEVGGLREDEADAPLSLMDIMLDGKGSNEARQVVHDFLCASGHPELTWSCLQYLCGYGTCEEHAKRHGMSRQSFNYHVRTLQEQLGLPPMGNQKKASSRSKYRQNNRRKLSVLTSTCEYGDHSPTA